jgi:hypothetical protein
MREIQNNAPFVNLHGGSRDIACFVKIAQVGGEQ